MAKKTISKGNRQQKRKGKRQSKSLRGGDLSSVSAIMSKYGLVQQDYEKLAKYMTYGDLAGFVIYPENIGQNGTLSPNTVIVAKSDDNKIVIIVGKHADKALIGDLMEHISKTNNEVKVIKYEDNINYRANKDILETDEGREYDEYNYDPEAYEYFKTKTRLSFNDGTGIELVVKDAFKNGEGKIKFSNFKEPKINILESEIYMPKGKIEDNVLMNNESKQNLKFAESQMKKHKTDKKYNDDFWRAQPSYSHSLISGGRKRKTLKRKHRRRRNSHKRRN